MNRTFRRIGLCLTGACLALATASVVGTHSAHAAVPPKDCDTPDQNNSTGVLETPQSTDNSGSPFLTKTFSQSVNGTQSITYFFTLATTRSTANDSGSGGTVTYTANTLTDTSKTWTANQWAHASVTAGASVMATVASNTASTLTLTANWSSTPAAGTPYTISFFSELLDCAWDVTQGGNASLANYSNQQNVPTFTSSGQLTVSMTATNSDAICDRVQLKGSTPSGTAFVDYSNLVGSPNGTPCTLPNNTPEVPLTAALLVLGGGSIAITVMFARRRRTGTGMSAAG